MDTLLPPAELTRGSTGEAGNRSVPGRSGASTVVRSVLVALLAALFVRAFLLEIVSIPSPSMAPTLEPGDQVLVNRFIYSGPGFRFLPRRPVARGDVVLFRPPFDRRQEFVKRCVGLAGDWQGGGVLAPGTLWMEGDARTASLDSRRFGAVPEDALEGRVLAVLWSRSKAPEASRRIFRQVR